MKVKSTCRICKAVNVFKAPSPRPNVPKDFATMWAVKKCASCGDAYDVSSEGKVVYHG